MVPRSHDLSPLLPRITWLDEVAEAIQTNILNIGGINKDATIPASAMNDLIFDIGSIMIQSDVLKGRSKYRMTV